MTSRKPGAPGDPRRAGRKAPAALGLDPEENFEMQRLGEKLGFYLDPNLTDGTVKAELRIEQP